MSKEQSYLRIIAANASIQKHIAVILEAKAKELEKSRIWTCSHLHPQQYEDHKDLLEEPLKVHEQMIEIIEGITKVENGLAKNLSILLEEEEDNEGMFGGGFDLNRMFDGSGDGK